MFQAKVVSNDWLVYRKNKSIYTVFKAVDQWIKLNVAAWPLDNQTHALNVSTQKLLMLRGGGVGKKRLRYANTLTFRRMNII